MGREAGLGVGVACLLVVSLSLVRTTHLWIVHLVLPTVLLILPASRPLRLPLLAGSFCPHSRTPSLLTPRSASISFPCRLACDGTLVHSAGAWDCQLLPYVLVEICEPCLFLYLRHIHPGSYSVAPSVTSFYPPSRVGTSRCAAYNAHRIPQGS